MHKLLLEIDPEFCNILSSSSKVAEDMVNGFNAFGRMAVVHLASDDGFAAGEDTVRSFCEESHAIIGVDEGEIERQGAKDSS